MRTTMAIMSSLFLASSLVLSAQPMRDLVADLSGARTLDERTKKAEMIAARLDEVVESVLRAEKTASRREAKLNQIISEEGGLFPGDVTLANVQGRSTVVVAYNVPMTSSGSERRVLLRLWNSGSGGALSPLADSSGVFTPVQIYPIKEVRLSYRSMHPYMLLVGRLKHGIGQDALSLWDLDRRKCIWALKMPAGSNTTVEFGDTEIQLTYPIVETDGDQLRPLVRIDTYHWDENTVSLQSSQASEGASLPPQP